MRNRKHRFTFLCVTAMLLAGCNATTQTSDTDAAATATSSSTASLSAPGNSSSPTATSSSSDIQLLSKTNSEPQNGFTTRYFINGSISELSGDYALGTTTAAPVAVAALSSGENILTLDATNIEVDDSHQQVKIVDSQILGDSVIVAFTSLAGADKYNSGETTLGFALFSIKTGKQLGSPIYTSRSSNFTTIADLDKSNATLLTGGSTWQAGVPGKSIVTVSRKDAFAQGNNTGNVLILQDGKDPEVQNLTDDELKSAYILKNGKLEPIADSLSILATFAQFAEDKLIVKRDGAATAPYYFATAAEASQDDAGVQLPEDSGWSRNELGKFGATCNRHKVLSTDSSERDLGEDTTCISVTANGVVHAEKGTKQVDVLINKDGKVIDAPAEIGDYTDKYMVSSMYVYEYTF